MKRWLTLGAVLAVTVTGVVIAHAVPTTNFAKTVGWSTEYGTPGDDRSYGVAVGPAGDVYQAGSTDDAFPGFPNTSGNDVVLAKFKANGSPVWLVQFGDPLTHDGPGGVAVSPSGDVYVAGTTDGAFPSFTNQGGGDVFVAKYDKNGNRKWLQQVGTAGSEEVLGVAVSSAGEAYVTGTTDGSFGGIIFGGGGGFNDSFVMKFTSKGVMKWVQEFGTDNQDDATSIAVTAAGDAYVSGVTYGAFPATANPADADGFLAKFNKNGVRQWFVQFGSDGSDNMHGVGVNKSGDVYVGGYSDGDFAITNLGGDDAIVTKFAKNGAEVWRRQIGTGSNEFVTALVVAKTGNVYVSGDAQGAFAGFTSAGGQDNFMAGFTSAGGLVTIRQFGVNGQEEATAIGVLKSGDIVVGGYTAAAFTGLTFAGGGADPYLITFPPN